MIYFDSDLQNPYTDAIDIIDNHKQFINPVNYDVEKFKKQMITVLNERLINNIYCFLYRIINFTIKIYHLTVFSLITCWL